MKNSFKLLRPKQWLKSFVIFIPLFFSGELFNVDYLFLTFWGFISLSAASSSVYVFNDVMDSERDKLHPTKNKRPIPAGLLSKNKAWIICAVMLIVSYLTSVFFVRSEYFVLLITIYILTMVVYSLFLKHHAIIDTITISFGFVLRVLIGAILLQLELSSMLVLTIVGAALFVSFGKRKAEITRIGLKEAVKHRPAIGIFSIDVLNSILSGLFAITFMSYTLFAYSYNATGLPSITKAFLPPKLQDPQWLMLTVPIAFYTLVRYLILTYKKDIAASPENVWSEDKNLMYSFILWFIMAFVLIYLVEVLKIIGI